MEQITKLMNHSSKGELPFYYEKLNDVLYVLYAIDTPSSIKFMPKEDINALGVEEGELRNLSMANLMNANESLQIQGDRSTVSMVVADGIYEASFLLYDDLWTKENFSPFMKIIQSFYLINITPHLVKVHYTLE